MPSKPADWLVFVIVTPTWGVGGSKPPRQTLKQTLNQPLKQTLKQTLNQIM
jgi:hypothetical protein